MKNRGFRVDPSVEHTFRPPTRNGQLGCADCGGKLDMLGHVLARRRAASERDDDGYEAHRARYAHLPHESTYQA